MKKNILILLAVGLASFGPLSTSHAQVQPDNSNPPVAAPPNTTPPAGPGPAGGPPPGAPMQPPFRMGRSRATFQQTMSSLRRAKMELQRSSQDFDGHRQSAMDACDKAMAELQAVVQAQAAASRMAPPQGQVSPAPAPTPTPQAPPQ